MKTIYKVVFTYLIRAIMIYDELSQGFCFLGMPGYESHFDRLYKRANEAYRDTCDYYIDTTGELPPGIDPDYTTIIPGKWYAGKPDPKEASGYLLNRWRDWERESRDVYRECYDKLLDRNPRAAYKVFELVEVAGKNYRKAERVING